MAEQSCLVWLVLCWPCLVLACHVLACLVLACLVLSYHVLAFLVLVSLVLSCVPLWGLLLCPSGVFSCAPLGSFLMPLRGLFCVVPSPLPRMVVCHPPCTYSTTPHQRPWCRVQGWIECLSAITPCPSHAHSVASIPLPPLRLPPMPWTGGGPTSGELVGSSSLRLAI